MLSVSTARPLNFVRLLCRARAISTPAWCVLLRASCHAPAGCCALAQLLMSFERNLGHDLPAVHLRCNRPARLVGRRCEGVRLCFSRSLVWLCPTPCLTASAQRLGACCNCACKRQRFLLSASTDALMFLVRLSHSLSIVAGHDVHRDHDARHHRGGVSDELLRSGLTCRCAVLAGDLSAENARASCIVSCVRWIKD
jgi:hypothetical protein